jgi:hypothetical protein
MLEMPPKTSVAAAPPIRATDTLCIYDWSKWHGFLIQFLFPSAARIAAQWGESPEHIARRLPADCSTLLLHLDISVASVFLADVAALVRLLGARGIGVINASVLDIRKRTIQSHCSRLGLPCVSASRHGPGEELLMVKTDLNAGGYREKLLSRKQRKHFCLPTRACRLHKRRDYFIARRADLPPDVWTDPTIVVERYMTNREGRFYRVYAAGRAIIVAEAWTDLPIKRMEHPPRRKNYFLWRQSGDFRSSATDGPFGGPNLPPELSPRLLQVAGAFFDTYHVDFGAIDIVESQDSEFYVVDLTATPYWGDEFQPGFMEHLRSTSLH